MEEFRQKIEGVIETEPIKGLGLKLLGIGAENIVFETPASTRKIIKINTDYIIRKIAFLLGLTEISETEIDSSFKEAMTDREETKKSISDIFGPEHILRSGLLKSKIPLTKDLIIKIVEGNKDLKAVAQKLRNEETYEIETIIETQNVAQELQDPETFQTRDISTDLIIADKFYESKDIPEALARSRDLIDRNFLSKFDEGYFEEKYLKILREILEKIIRYTKNTGKMLDIFGANNITIFTKEDGSIDYHLLDVILPGPQNHWVRNIKDDPHFKLLRHNYTFFYSVKSLADKLGLSENIEPEDLLYFKGEGIPNSGTF